MTEEEVLAIARAGAAAGCREALFTLGDKPELRYKVAREELRALGCETTLEYLARCAQLVLEETGLLPHLNPGVMTRAELELLRPVRPSMGIMLETTAERLAERGGPHWASPDKIPARRLETIRLAGELSIPFTSGILIGIGETREERIDALLALKALGEEYGHVQEVIVQNFRAKPGTRMASHPEPSLDDHLWTIAVARILLGPAWHVQAPPNLAYEDFPRLLDAGIDDWGGVSPVTIDHVNPEAPWPEIERLARRHSRSRPRARATSSDLSRVRGRPGPLVRLRRRTACSPRRRRGRARARRRLGTGRAGGRSIRRPARPGAARAHRRRARRGRANSAARSPRGEGCSAFSRQRIGFDVRSAGTRSRTSSHGISSTRTSAISAAGSARSRKASSRRNLRGAPYLVPLEEIVRRTSEAWERGATEVCLQGGIHPAFTGDYYADVVRAIKDAVPGIHVHAFSALEMWQGAATLGLSGSTQYLARPARPRVSARCPGRLRRCSTTRCVVSSARTR